MCDAKYCAHRPLQNHARADYDALLMQVSLLHSQAMSFIISWQGRAPTQRLQEVWDCCSIQTTALLARPLRESMYQSQCCLPNSSPMPRWDYAPCKLHMLSVLTSSYIALPCCVCQMCHVMHPTVASVSYAPSVMQETLAAYKLIALQSVVHTAVMKQKAYLLLMCMAN